MSNKPNIVVAGGGAFGTALAIVLCEGQSADVTLWVRDVNQASDMATARENKKRLPEIALPQSLNITHDLSALSDADILLSVVPSSAQMDFIKFASTYIKNLSHLVICSKGFDHTDGALLTNKIDKNAFPCHLSVLSGPGFARDIANGLPTAMTLATVSQALNVSKHEHLNEILSRRTFRLYGSNDMIGVQVGGALKNVIAIAAGIAIGAGLGESARASIIARGLAEMSRLIAHMGGDVRTASGLSGLGDLVLTASSEQSRNYSFGLAIGKGQAIDQLTADDQPLVEGASAAQLAAHTASDQKIDLPLTKAVAAILSGQLEVKHAITQLLGRPLKHEQA